jgi:hypothetical protein
MENKQKKGMKPLHMLLLVLGGILLLALAMGATILIQQAARTKRPAAIATPEPTATPEATPIPDRSYAVLENPAFVPELDKLGLTEAELDYFGEENFAPEMWVDLTPDGFSGAVIRNIAVGYSYVVLDGSYYRLGEGSDGKGVLDVLLCDLNADDEPDLLYTYHFGTTEDGETKVGWFDCVDRRSVVSSFGMQKAYLALSEEDGAYLVYRCTRSVDETGAFALHFTDRIGEILEKGGELYLMME